MASVSRIEPPVRAHCGVDRRPARHRLSVDAYYRMAETGILDRGARVELIDGEIFDMSPIGVLHAAVVNVLVRHFTRHFSTTTFVSSQNPLRLDDENEPEPDLLILRPRPDCYCTAHPTPVDTRGVIEVADTSLAYDLEVKVPLYARHGIPEVWVIEAETRCTHVFRTPLATTAGSNSYAEKQRIQADEPLPFATLTAADGEGLPVSLAQLLPGVA